MSELDVTKYFIIHKDKNNNIFAIEQINPKELFEEITKQNEQLHRYKQAIEEIEKIARLHAPMCNGCDRDEFNCDICHLYDLKNIIQKCKEMNGKN